MIHTFTTDEHRWLSNMWYVDIPLKGVIYASVEHAYQAEKSLDKDWKAFCADRNNKNTDVKRASRNIIVRADWDDVKLLVMEYCLNEKFKVEPYRELLLKTGNQNLQEGNYWGDVFWGVDLKKNPNVGENHLGRLLMKIRSEIK